MKNINLIYPFKRVNECSNKPGTLLLILAMTLGLVSCEDYLEVDLPDNQLTTEAIFNNYATAEASLLNIYTSLRDESLLTGTSSGLGPTMGLYTDDLDLYSNSFPSLNEFYLNALIPTNSTVSNFWNTGYNLIYNANTLIKGVENSAGLSIVQKNQLIGEALFLRALIYFHITNLFGDIPYIISPDYNLNIKVERLEVSEIYKMVIEDLMRSKEALEENSEGQNGKNRINAEVVTAFLARVHLYNEQYSLAQEAASEVINSEDYQLKSTVEGVFLKESVETIWQFSPNTPGGNTIEAQSYIFTSTPPPSYALTSDLVNSFESEDHRLGQWIEVVSDSTTSYYHAFKYKETENTGSTLENSIVLRLPEQYLIRSEARLALGDIDGALQDLNKIRERAGLLPVSSENEEEIIQFIIEERRHEFFTEFGHRFFDLKRTGVIDSILSMKEGWETTDKLLPIPAQELINNPLLLPQNPGYE